MKRWTYIGEIGLIGVLALAAGCAASEEVAEIECGALAAPIAVNEAYSPTMPQTSDPYPAACQYYAVMVPEGRAELEVVVGGMTADLDVTVQYGECFFRNAWESDSDTWYSNQEGTADEVIRIASPPPGAYYVEVCSYGGSATPYTLSTALR